MCVCECKRQRRPWQSPRESVRRHERTRRAGQDDVDERQRDVERHAARQSRSRKVRQQARADERQCAEHEQGGDPDDRKSPHPEPAHHSRSPQPEEEAGDRIRPPGAERQAKRKWRDDVHRPKDGAGNPAQRHEMHERDQPRMVVERAGEARFNQQRRERDRQREVCTAKIDERQRWGRQERAAAGGDAGHSVLEISVHRGSSPGMAGPDSPGSSLHVSGATARAHCAGAMSTSAQSISPAAAARAWLA